jgi:hypothetical protein
MKRGQPSVRQALMAQRLYRPAHGACPHCHPTVVDAIECARNLHSDLEIVALKNGHVERLNEVEERIRSVVSASYDKTEREIFDIRWGESLSRFADAEREIFYTQRKQSGTLSVRTLRNHAEKTPYKNEYKCPYGNKNCGEKARYCEPCNKRFEEFLLILGYDR